MDKDGSGKSERLAKVLARFRNAKAKVHDAVVDLDTAFDEVIGEVGNLEEVGPVRPSRIDRHAVVENGHRIHFDFAKRKLTLDGEEKRIPDNQPWSLLEVGIRHDGVHLLDGFVAFSEWRRAQRQFNPKRRFGTVIGHTNDLIGPFGLRLERIVRGEDRCELAGWSEARHDSNIVVARDLLEKAIDAVRSKPADWITALKTAMDAFDIDPRSPPAAFFIIKCARKLRSGDVPMEIARAIYRLLRQQDSVYTDAIAVIEGCEALGGITIGGQIREDHSHLRRIKQHRELALTLPPWVQACDSDEIYVDGVVKSMKAIRESCTEGKCADVRKMRRAKDVIYKGSGDRVTDGQIAEVMGVKPQRLRLIREWERKLAHHSFDEEQDDDSSWPET